MPFRKQPASFDVHEGKIIRNAIRCKRCGDEVESTHRHDFKFCKCGAVAVDGGKEYLRRLGNRDDIEDLSEFAKP